MQQETLHTVAQVADKTTITAVSVSFFGGLTSNDIAAYGGIIIGAIGLIVATIFRYLEGRELKRHHKTMEAKRWADE